MLHTCNGVFQRPCDAGKSHVMLCDVNSNIYIILLPILKYLSYLLPDFPAVFSIMAFSKLSCDMTLIDHVEKKY